MADRDDLEFTYSLIEQDWPRSNPARLSSLSPRRVWSRFGCLCSLGAGIVGRRASTSTLVRSGQVRQAGVLRRALGLAPLYREAYGRNRRAR
jgi:hypothetical protein